MASSLPDADDQRARAAPAADDTPPPPPRYRSAYSRFVTLMKFGLPLVAGALVLLVIAWPQLASRPDRFTIGLSDLRIETAGGQRVVNARFTGVDRDNRPFSVTAASVIQEKTGSNRVNLAEPKADVTLQGESWAALTAPRGVYWRDREVLELSGRVDLFHDQGYEFTTGEARIDFRAGSAAGDTPIKGQGPFGTIAADGFRIYDSGDRIVFSGRARLLLFPSSTDAVERGK